MQCPGCHGVLQWKKHQHVEFYVCSVCRGIWVGGEQFHALAILVAEEGNVESSAKLTFEPRKVIRAIPENDALARKCPHCHTAMHEFNYAYDSNVFLDRCPECHGIWLDPNEIIDIAKHIQYNPKLDAAARGLIHNGGSVEGNDDEGFGYMLAGAALAVLRVLVFRR